MYFSSFRWLNCKAIAFYYRVNTSEARNLRRLKQYRSNSRLCKILSIELTYSVDFYGVAKIKKPRRSQYAGAFVCV